MAPGWDPAIDSHSQERRVSSQQSRQRSQQTSSGAGRPPDADVLGTDNYYKLLNVPYSATKAEIRKAYRQSMMRAHPDRVPASRRAAAEDLAKLLNRAYFTLIDPVKRLEYDKTIREDVLQSEIMNRYVGGFGGGGIGGAPTMQAQAPRREMSERERRDREMSDRSAMVTIFSVFTVVTLAAIVLLLAFALLSFAFSALL